jgi:tRNA C32,U32 (ribose-2'-O)-methylase TrmJ
LDTLEPTPEETQSAISFMETWSTPSHEERERVVSFFEKRLTKKLMNEPESELVKSIFKFISSHIASHRNRVA